MKPTTWYNFLKKENHWEKTKWVFKWLRGTIEENTAKLKKIHTNKNASIMLTKVVPKQKF